MANHSNKSWEKDFFSKILDIDDTPIEDETTAPISSNWAFDHSANSDAHGGPYNNYSHPDHTGQVTSSGDGSTTVTVSAITSQIDINGDVVGSDELIVSDGGTIKRMSVEDFNTYFNANLNFNDYTHPTENGDDIAVDLTPLTGANVVDDINITVTTDTLGHVTAASASVGTRALTPSDIAAQHTNQKGQTNGYASLDSGGKVPSGELPAGVVGAMVYEGTWNATTNVPDLDPFPGDKGHYYVVATAGTFDLDGITDWEIGDWVVYNGSIVEKIDNSDKVASVNGAVGVVVLNTDDINEAGGVLYHTTERVQDVSGAQIDTNGSHTGITATYDDDGDGAIDLAVQYSGSGSATTASHSDHDHTGVYEPVDSTIIRETDIDDEAVDGVTDAPISSNWAYDHENNPAAHDTPIWVKKTGAYTAESGDLLVADTTGGVFTITLPITPSANDSLRIKTTITYTNNLTIARNGENILSTAEDYIIDGNYIDITLVYVDSTIGWLI
jgi:hypothetical protein